MTGDNEDLLENAEKPAAIPVRPLRLSELLELRYQARQVVRELEALAAMLDTFNQRDKYVDVDESLDGTGHLCQEIIIRCSGELKAQDLPKKRRK